MATRDSMISAALKEVKAELAELGRKLDSKLDNTGKDLGELRDRITRVETRVSIVFGIIAAIGIAVLGVAVKLLFPGK